MASLPSHSRLESRMEPQPEHSVPSISFASYARLLRHNRNFRRLWMAQIVSEVGDWFYTLSIYTLLLQLTGHAGSVALALVLQVLPQTFVGPTAGVGKDRLGRKHVKIAAEDEVLVANTLSSATWSVNLLIGASVGGVVAALFGRDTVFILNALSFLTSAFLISGMRFAEPHAESAAPLRARDLVDYSPVLEGIRYIRSHPTLLPAVFAKAGE